MLYPHYLQSFAPYITLLLLFLDGYIFGFIAKKSVLAVILLLIALIIGIFLGMVLIGVPSLATIISFTTHYLSNFAPIFHLGSNTVILFVLIFIIGLALGIWKS
ncbi:MULTISPECIES: hypothetical protein [Acidiplasma]|jgi:hypothetical protein|uniref:Uncharacterized protein n=3 Tax=Acidiplasma TaxID=507753 RepID=A0A0Q1B4Q2_9ARCH|nr:MULTISPECIES: hypothetical protein [Acidiplasma]KJE49487.1 hypothetical protein TZ01_05590 [Acidiplasma sp. MBA-1]KPV47105.1 hypothetical protein SE19_02510 [Acidiplasma aeolicum]KQB34368.1 hypothetical protein AOG54_05105 [Acidiplasma aeolicum]KQB34938.1 hypothetical protein AOG55_08585 [Acidiplasma cupricumulans]WMT54530.1 MAG: hypothetical protein RE470_06325 [Acidiplasma sp.]